MGPAGTCPSCSRSLRAEAGTSTATGSSSKQGPGQVAELEEGVVATVPRPTVRAKGAPWHFKLLVVGVTVYMIYRIYWLVEWLPKHL